MCHPKDSLDYGTWPLDYITITRTFNDTTLPKHLQWLHKHSFVLFMACTPISCLSTTSIWILPGGKDISLNYSSWTGLIQTVCCCSWWNSHYLILCFPLHKASFKKSFYLLFGFLYGPFFNSVVCMFMNVEEMSLKSVFNIILGSLFHYLK